MKPSIAFKIAFRSIMRTKAQSLISILGLGVGLGSILLLSMLYLHENSFDNFVPENQQVYRVLHGTSSRLPFALGDAVANDIPSIENFFRYQQSGEFNIRNSNREITTEERYAYADGFIFDCLGIKMVVGKPAESKNEVCISERMAAKYFGSLNAIGQVIEVRLSNDFIKQSICGVYKNLPSNSSITPNFIGHTNMIAQFMGTRKKMLGEYDSGVDQFKTNWEQSVCLTYIKLSAKADVEAVTHQLQNYTANFESEKKKEREFQLQNVREIYLGSDEISDTFSHRGNVAELKYFIGIALFILLIAVINYIFLTNAKMNGRLKELGAKRALGAQASSIRKQMLFEANFVSLLSLLPAMLVVAVGIPFVNSTLGRTLDLHILTEWYTIPLLLLIPLLTGTLSGLLVGIKISRASTVLLLNKKLTRQPKKHQWSNSFLSLHFAVFIVLISGVLVLSKQINYALNNFTAINPENVIICELNTPELTKKFDVIKDQVQQMPGVINTAGSSFIPPFDMTLPIQLKDRESQEVISIDGLIMGQGMTELLGIEMIEGEHFGEYKKGSRRFIFNESAALKYDLKVGESFNGFYVHGIAKDFTAHTMHSLIKPMMIMQQHPSRMRLFAIKTTGETDTQIIASVTSLFKDISPNNVPSVYTLRDQINQFYVKEQNQSKLISAFSLLAVVLSIMGLIGIVMNTLSRKTKEIGIRKVNGAKVFEILDLLNREFIKWVVLAFVIACPIAYYAMKMWLENFAYKTSLSWWIFALAGVLALFIAMLTVTWQSWRAATRNPVEALRYE